MEFFMDTQIQQTFEQLKQTISVSTSPFHTAKEAMRRLNEAGFVTLDWDSTWELVPGGKYAVCPFGTTVFGFQIGTDLSDTPVWKLSSSHIDNPGFRIKYNPVVSSKNGCRLNTEVYGGAIYSTWLGPSALNCRTDCVKKSTICTPAPETGGF